MAREPYPRLRRRDFVLSSVGRFGRKGFFMLPVRSIKRLYRLRGRSERILSLNVEPVGKHTQHSAASMKLSYYSLLGKAVGQVEQRVIADGVQGNVIADVSVRPPKGAAWCLVSLGRLRGPRQMAVSCDWGLRAVEGTKAASDIVDARAHKKAFERFKTAGDRPGARRELNALIRHYGEPWQMTELRQIEDANRVLTTRLDIPAAGLQVRVGEDDCKLASLVDPDNDHGLPISKWLRFECLTAAMAMKDSGIRRITVPDGDAMLARAVVAAVLASANPHLTLAVDLDALRVAGGRFGPWLRFTSGEEFLGTPCADGVRKVLNLN